MQLKITPLDAMKVIISVGGENKSPRFNNSSRYRDSERTTESQRNLIVHHHLTCRTTPTNDVARIFYRSIIAKHISQLQRSPPIPQISSQRYNKHREPRLSPSFCPAWLPLQTERNLWPNRQIELGFLVLSKQPANSLMITP